MSYLRLVVFGLVLVLVETKLKECIKDCEGKIDEKTVCKDTCNDKHLGDLINATQRQNTLSIPGKPTLVSSKYTSISLTWNTTSRIIAVGYILQVQANWIKQSVNEYFPYIKKYHQFNYTNQSGYTVENLQSKTNYKFRVAVLLLNQTSVFSEWSDLIPTNNSCNKGSCGLTNFRIRLSSRVPDKGEEVLNATFHWEPTTASDLSDIDYRFIYIDIYPLSTHDSCRTRFDQEYHETLNKSKLNLTDKDSSFFKFPNRKADPKRLMYFDCWYQVNIRVTVSGKEKEIGSWISHLPECIEVPAKICGCPYVGGQSKEKVINLDFIPSSVNTTRDVIVSWSNEMWKNDTKVKYYEIFIPGLLENYVDSVKGMHNYNTTLHDLKYEGTYTILVFAYHSDHCIHDKRAILKFNVKEVCRSNPCSDNEICIRADYLGNHKCKCKDGYITLNGTCVDAKPCVPNPCPVNKKCYPKLTGTFECNCFERFEDVNGTCRDTHPCQSYPCSKNEICYPKKPIGTYGCNCSANFEKVNGTCEAIKESKVTTNTEKIVLSVTIPLVVIIIIAVVVIFWMRSYQKRRLRAVDLASVMYRPESVNNYLNNQPSHMVNLPPVSGKGQHFSEDGREVNFLYVPQEIAEAIASGLTNGLFELPPDRFTFRKVIGKGAFGEVFLGEAYGFRNSPGPTKVAIKKLAESATGAEIKDFLHEIKLMKELGKHVHENVIQMYGCCTVNSPVCLLMEYASGGNLLVYLRSLKQKSEEKAVLSTNVENKSMTESEQEKFGSSIKLSEIAEEWKAYSKSSSHVNVEQVQARNTEIAEKVSQAYQTALDPKELESFARQIVNGMSHVAGLGIVHRDLAARNILLGQNNVLKISDFGLSREAGIYVMNANGKIPFRWLSIEAIKERRYSSASDVWAFGIVLCEIFTLGDVPYASMDDNDLLGFLERGNRMKKAKSCSDEIYALMLKCWSHWPEERPTFPELSHLLRELEDHSYINLDTLMMSSPSSAANRDNGSDNDTQQEETILSPVDLACGSNGIESEVLSSNESEEQSFLSPSFKFPDGKKTRAEDETILSPACGSIGVQDEMFSPNESEEQSFLSPNFKFTDEKKTKAENSLPQAK